MDDVVNNIYVTTCSLLHVVLVKVRLRLQALLLFGDPGNPKEAHSVGRFD